MTDKYPPGWGIYLRNSGVKPSNEVAQFVARYRLAAQFESVNVSGYHAATARGYSALMRVAFAYSAYEALTKAKVKGAAMDKAVVAPGLAEQLRAPACRRMLACLQSDTRTEELKLRVERFEVGIIENVLPVAEATRHLVFHGATSVSSMGLGSTRAAETLEGLADALLAHCSAAFKKLAAGNALK